MLEFHCLCATAYGLSLGGGPLSVEAQMTQHAGSSQWDTLPQNVKHH